MTAESFYAGAERVMSEFLGLTGSQKLCRRTYSRKVQRVVGQGGAAAMLEEMYEVMTSKPDLNLEKSQQNWLMKRKVDGKCKGGETCLEKSVAMLAKNGHMPGWYNQVPTASGVVGSGERRANVDLAHWDESRGILRLIELKWKINTDAPSYALYEAIKSGLAYIYFRAERIRRPMLERPRHVALEVVAPDAYFARHDQQVLLREISEALAPFAKSKIGEGAPDMSVNMYAFPPDFSLPFATGKEVREKCDTDTLTAEGKIIRDAFANLSPVWK